MDASSFPPPTPKVRALRDYEVVWRFPPELTNGLIRADTARSLADLIRKVVDIV